MMPGCGADSKAASGTGVYFDTVVDIRVYGDNADALLSGCFDICERMEKTLSAHDEESELYRINHRDKAATGIEVSDELSECIAEGLYYSEASGGAFDITILPLSDIWDFKSDAPSVPSDDEIKEAVKKVDHRKVHLNGNIISFDDPETKIDLGGIAKGFVSAKLREYLISEGCTSALINLGGNVSAIGAKPDGSGWVVGIQEPYADRGTVFEKAAIIDKCVVSSGTYERYFTVGDKRYHHILDPKTGYSADTALYQASVIGDDDVLCDALSTICVLLGKEGSEKLIEEKGWDTAVLFIDTEMNGEWYGDKP
ncbi:MAG: FAD:protein FMN transferase [Lachnospiraceae bacterium]|nr:FAD:protein FMN transferase [Lachnospiraceae bacterium]